MLGYILLFLGKYSYPNIYITISMLYYLYYNIYILTSIFYHHSIYINNSLHNIMKETKLSTTEKNISRIASLQTIYYSNDELKNSLNSNKNNSIVEVVTNNKDNYFISFRKQKLKVINGIIKTGLNVGYFRGIKKFHSKEYRLKKKPHTLNNMKHCLNCEINLYGLPFRSVSSYLKTILGSYKIKKIKE